MEKRIVKQDQCTKKYYLQHQQNNYEHIFWQTWVEAVQYAVSKNISVNSVLEIIAMSDGMALLVNRSDDSDYELSYCALRKKNILKLMETHQIITEI
jgi:hypothetical protein